MASAPSPRDSISANGPLWVASRTRPLEPTQIAPEFSTTGNNAAARPPVMGSLAVARATRFETTTRFTGFLPENSPLYKQPFINMVPRHLPTRIGPNLKEPSGTHNSFHPRTPPFSRPTITAIGLRGSAVWESRKARVDSGIK